MKRFFQTLKIISVCCFMALGSYALSGCVNREDNANACREREYKTLEKAYAAGWLTRSDLKGVAYYYNARHDEAYYATHEFYDENWELVEYVQSPEQGFVPKPMAPDMLSEKTVQKIKSTYRENGLTQNISILAYYGTYDTCVVYEASFGSCMDGGGDPPYYSRYIIDGVIFYEYTPLFVWRSENEI